MSDINDEFEAIAGRLEEENIQETLEAHEAGDAKKALELLASGSGCSMEDLVTANIWNSGEQHVKRALTAILLGAMSSGDYEPVLHCIYKIADWELAEEGSDGEF